MNKIKFQPFGYNVLLEKPVIDKKTKAGVIKSDSMLKEEEANSSDYLKVCAIGGSVTEVIVGDEVLAPPGAHRMIVIDDITYIIVSQGTLAGKLLK